MKHIAVIGAGTMGNGIAHVFAQYGHQVTLIDRSSELLDRGLSTIRRNMDRQVEKEVITTAQRDAAITRIKAVTTMDGLLRDCFLVVEAATENKSIKLDIFRQLDRETGPETILASNTSSISITEIASVTGKPQQVIGMHFMNPVPVMKLVEVIRGSKTSHAVADAVMACARDLDKVPVMVNDSPGFVANRILMPMINEAIRTLQEGVADVSGIDTVMKLGMAHPMGPLQLADLIGLDVCLSIMQVLDDGLAAASDGRRNEYYAPATLLKDMVAAGELGIKSGSGFYRYVKGSKELVVADRFR